MTAPVFSMEDQKRRQVEYHEREHYSARPRQTDNSNPLIAWLNSFRLNKLVDMIGVSLEGKTLLSVSGGDGDEADFLARQGAIVTMTDLSCCGRSSAHPQRFIALHADGQRMSGLCRCVFRLGGGARWSPSPGEAAKRIV